MIFIFLWIDDNPKRIFNLMEIRVIKMKLIMRKNLSKLYFIDWNIFFLFFICLGYVVTMRSLNGDWQENIPSEESSKNVLSGPFEALNFICLSTPSLDVCKFHYLFDFFSFLFFCKNFHVIYCILKSFSLEFWCFCFPFFACLMLRMICQRFLYLLFLSIIIWILLLFIIMSVWFDYLFAIDLSFCQLLPSFILSDAIYVPLYEHTLSLLSSNSISIKINICLFYTPFFYFFY